MEADAVFFRLPCKTFQLKLFSWTGEACMACFHWNWNHSQSVWSPSLFHSLCLSLSPSFFPNLSSSLSISYLVMASVSLRAARTFTHIINDTSSLGAPAEWAANLRGSRWWAISVECNNYRRAAVLLLQRWMVTEDRSQGLFTHQLVGRKCMFSRSTPC